MIMAAIRTPILCTKSPITCTMAARTLMFTFFLSWCWPFSESICTPTFGWSASMRSTSSSLVLKWVWLWVGHRWDRSDGMLFSGGRRKFSLLSLSKRWLLLLLLLARAPAKSIESSKGIVCRSNVPPLVDRRGVELWVPLVSCEWECACPCELWS